MCLFINLEIYTQFLTVRRKELVNNWQSLNISKRLTVLNDTIQDNLFSFQYKLGVCLFSKWIPKIIIGFKTLGMISAAYPSAHLITHNQQPFKFLSQTSLTFYPFQY